MPTRSGTSTLSQGELVLFPFPFSDHRRGKLRPALIVSNDAYNASSRDALACGLTSNLANTAHSVLVEPADLVNGRLLSTSRVKADKIFALEQSLVRTKIGILRPAVLAAVRKEIIAIL